MCATTECCVHLTIIMHTQTHSLAHIHREISKRYASRGLNAKRRAKPIFECNCQCAISYRRFGVRRQHNVWCPKWKIAVIAITHYFFRSALSEHTHFIFFDNSIILDTLMAEKWFGFLSASNISWTFIRFVCGRTTWRGTTNGLSPTPYVWRTFLA